MPKGRFEECIISYTLLSMFHSLLSMFHSMREPIKEASSTSKIRSCSNSFRRRSIEFELSGSIFYSAKGRWSAKCTITSFALCTALLVNAIWCPFSLKDHYGVPCCKSAKGHGRLLLQQIFSMCLHFQLRTSELGLFDHSAFSL